MSLQQASQPRDLPGRALTAQEFMRELGIQKSLYYKLRAQGRYDFLLVHPAPGGRRIYSGALIQRWLNGAGTSQRGGLRRVNGGRAR